MAGGKRPLLFARIKNAVSLRRALRRHPGVELRPDVLSGGFPCQDISNAGKRTGIRGERSCLWWEYLRAVRALRPLLAVVENVAAIRHRGLDRVLGDVAEGGYDAEWDCLPACAFGANHERDRLFAVAYPQGLAERPGFRPFYAAEVWRGRLGDGVGATPVCDADGFGRAGLDGGRSAGAEPETRRSNVPNAYGVRRYGRRGRSAAEGWELSQSLFGSVHTVPDARGEGLEGEKLAEVADAGEGRQDPFAPGSGWWAVEPDMGRVAYGVPHRVDRIRALGNAVVPQVAEAIGRRVVEFLAENN
jgi:DNA (cytosine-5)-methyltransferase 1